MSSKKPSRQERRAAERKLKKVESVTQTVAAKSEIKTPSSSKWYMGLIAIAITFMCFSNVGGLGFVNWDDDKNFSENPAVVNFNIDDFGPLTSKIFTSDVIGNYNPLTIFTFAMDKVMFGKDGKSGLDNPGPWHWENLLFHLLCVFLVYRICLLLGLTWKGGLFVALLFGIHPMRVESVTWVTERKDVLFGFFFLWALYIYVRGKINPKKLDVLWITILMVLSCLAKIQAVALPLTMLAVDYYMDNKVSIKNIITKGHYFLLSLATGFVGIHFLRLQGSIESAEVITGFKRIFIGSYSFIVYCIKIFVPYKLSPLYPYPQTLPWYFYASIIALPLVLWVLWKSHKMGKKHIVFGLGVFIFNIIFLLQILGAGQGFLADRFSYIPYLGLFFILGYYFDQFTKTNHKLQSTIYGLGGAFVLAMGFMTFNQNKIWKDSGTLWTHVLKYDKNTNLPYGNRANFYRDNKQYDLAFADYGEAIRLKPNNPEALNSRAKLHFNKGGAENLKLAAADYQTAIEKKGGEPAGANRDESLGEYYINLGAVYAMLGNPKGALEEFNKGLKLKPNHESGYLNRSVIYNKLGDYPNALKDIETYFKYNRYNADLWYEAARLKRAMNRFPEAVQDYSEAIRLNPQKGVFYYERSRTQKQINQIDAAKSDLAKAIQLKYDKIDPEYRAQWGM